MSTARDAALTICRHARDEAEARMLLGMCGLLGGDPLTGTALAPSARTCTSCGEPAVKWLGKLQDHENGLCHACHKWWVNAGRPDDAVPDPVFPRPYRAGGRKPRRPRAAARQ